ncbi:hypothetical protein BWI15_04875 [Kribbella sp. ALI-6-A]|uniref:hypothetical protein n=1 Tax=Kribbella sp. ALI-6-A TaxID=1933817 RepID=UPI00097BF41B|nr:hypothetical protein [Kribbella sp. ALI-6-A]ONI76633.1 hypothetical protein BWI15_04875 [Kribbella sp. ALI-6-A]
MTDTESRLRDYLQAKAATIPDDAEAPGLETPRGRSRVWTPLLAAAAVAVLIASAALVAHLHNPPVAPDPQPPGLRVPYVLTALDQQRELHDGDQVVELNENVAEVVGRVSGGWLIHFNTATSAQLGVLAADGTVRPVGPEGVTRPVLSPDHTQVAVVQGIKQVQVYDVASGRLITERTLPYEARLHETNLHGWNQAGIWASKADRDQRISQLLVWQPTTGRLTPVTPPKSVDAIDVAPQSSAIPFATTVGKQRCLTSAHLSEGRLIPGSPFCSPDATNPVVSPDGATLAVGDAVVDIRTGKRTPLQLAAAHISELPTFEDADHVLVVQALREDGRPASPMVSDGTPAEELPHATVFRCAVGSGACEKVLVAPDLKQIELIEP